MKHLYNILIASNILKYKSLKLTKYSFLVNWLLTNQSKISNFLLKILYYHYQNLFDNQLAS